MSIAKKSFLIRMRIISAFIILISLFILTRLFFIQIIKSDAYTESADRSYIKSAETFDRGVVFFKKKDGGRISAATVTTGFLLAVNPEQIKDAELAYEKISEIIDLNKDDFIRRATKKDDPYEEVGKKISKENADKIKALGFDGVYLYKQKWRFYPGNEMASHAVGFIAYDQDNLTGRYGVEKYYNETLEKEEEQLYVNIFAEIFSGIGEAVFDNTNRSGDVVMTIEPTVQNSLEKELERVTEAFNPEEANGIIIDPRTGAIIAMAHYPTFNLNESGAVQDVTEYSNPLVENIFEFGSVVKPLVIAAGLDAGVITKDTPYYDVGYITIEDKKIQNYDKKGRGQVVIQDVLAQSLNTGMVFTMQQLGRSQFRDYMVSYQIGEKTNIDLPNEAKGIISNLYEPRELEYATASFGQGISFSPVALVRALSSLANGGYLVRPHVVSEIDYHDGGSQKFEFPKEDQSRVLKPETSEEITRMMVAIVDETLGGGSYSMPHHSIAAKTGTAQIPNPIAGGYYENQNLHSFFGYLPAYDPQFLVFLSIKSPRGVKYAAETLTKPFFDIAKFLISYYELPPDR